MPYIYRCRPGYGSQELLLEFWQETETSEFYIALFEVLDQLQARVVEMLNIWMNEEIMREMDSSLGPFSIHHDLWNLVFIMSKENQPVIKAIDLLLQADERFHKQEVDFEVYK